MAKHCLVVDDSAVIRKVDDVNHAEVTICTEFWFPARMQVHVRVMVVVHQTHEHFCNDTPTDDAQVMPSKRLAIFFGGVLCLVTPGVLCLFEDVIPERCLVV